jgi:hypothetical protein
MLRVLLRRANFNCNRLCAGLRSTSSKPPKPRYTRLISMASAVPRVLSLSCGRDFRGNKCCSVIEIIQQWFDVRRRKEEDEAKEAAVRTKKADEEAEKIKQETKEAAARTKKADEEAEKIKQETKEAAARNRRADEEAKLAAAQKIKGELQEMLKKQSRTRADILRILLAAACFLVCESISFPLFRHFREKSLQGTFLGSGHRRSVVHGE